MKVRNVNKKRVKHPMTLRTHYKRCYYDWCERERFILRNMPTLPTLEEALAEYEHDKFMSTEPHVVNYSRPINYIGDDEDIKDFAYYHLHEFCDV
jgi:hypothetical protein